ncbi:MFS transporter [Phytohabitans flavus]|uniref:MFS transporter n=1 Tax=Phytohabitans flavus TaxID=1076124 RepID=A0A6F8XRK2_9ACTN|nr:MFS transporter [Phytohabitans flavus]BCB76437.1 MFS transporter [Phytohabitans flavus]
METTTATAAPARAGRREWIGLAVLALPTLLLALDTSVLYLALPQVSADLGADGNQTLWILDIYSFVLAGFLVTMGTLGDRIGRRRLLLIGAAAFGGASILAAYSTSAEMLIATRALLGLAGATLMPSTMALIRNMFPDPKQMGTAIGVWFSCFMGGMAIGPLVGGAMLEHFWWGSAFLLGVPFMALLLVVGPVLLPEYRTSGAGRLDLASVGLSLAAILPAIYGLKELARGGWDPVAAGAVVVGLAVGVVFVRRQGTLADPLLDLRLFGYRVFRSALSVYLLTGVVMAGVSLMSTVYLQSVLELSTLRAGLWLLPHNVALVAGFLLAPRLAARFRQAYVMAAGMVFAAAGLALLLLVEPGDTALLVTGLVLAHAGISLPMALSANIIIGAAPAEKAGSAASLMETSAEFGIAMGVATLGTLGTAMYRGSFEAPAAVPADAAEAARESITAAGGAAAGLPPAPAAELLHAAQAAFTSGLNVVGAVGAAVFLVLAVIVYRGSRPA